MEVKKFDIERFFELDKKVDLYMIKDDKRYIFSIPLYTFCVDFEQGEKMIERSFNLFGDPVLRKNVMAEIQKIMDEN